MLSERELKFARRFHYTMTKYGYWDIPVNALRHLIKINLVDHPGCGRYAVSDKLNKLMEQQVDEEVVT